MEKSCNRCKIIKSINEFTKDKHVKSGYTAICTKCRGIANREYYKNNPEKAKIKNDKQKENRKKYYQTPEGIESSRRAHLKRTFNLTLEEYDQMLEKQNHKCAICSGVETYDRFNVLAVDHCHTTGIIRGLLCFKCNVALGGFDDNVELLTKATEYLNKYNN